MGSYRHQPQHHPHRCLHIGPGGLQVQTPLGKNTTWRFSTLPDSARKTPHKGLFSAWMLTWWEQPCHKTLLDASFMSQVSKWPPHLHLLCYRHRMNWIFFIWAGTLQYLYMVIWDSWFQVQECWGEIVESCLCVRHWNSFKSGVSWSKQRRHNFGIY